MEKRRTFIAKALALLTGLSFTGHSNAKAVNRSPDDQTETPLYSPFTRWGDLIFISGKNAPASLPDIKTQTEAALDAMEQELRGAGSAMEKVLKVTVYLTNMADFPGMNDAYLGRFGTRPPARTTVAVIQRGIAGGSLIEIDCIAHV